MNIVKKPYTIYTNEQLKTERAGIYDIFYNLWKRL